ncbi:hypothetical protein [Azospirillum sp. B2RO_4]|uniref:hypothetical protein n=1 Tax=Azospirillum sp. B2RO_4 TaxID=3027796 RepID=UPI003DA9C898
MRRVSSRPATTHPWPAGAGIQGVGSLTDHPLPMSRRFAEILPPDRTALAGAYSLKGFAKPVDLYERLGPQSDLPPL